MMTTTVPTKEAIEANPTVALERIRALRSELDEAESLAITVALRRGWTLSHLAYLLGISRQAMTQRMQRKLGTRQPNAILRAVAVIERAEELRLQRAAQDERVRRRHEQNDQLIY